MAQLRCEVLTGLAEAREAAGDLRGAADAWARAMLAQMVREKGDWNAHGPEKAAERFWEVVKKLPAEQWPPMLWLHVLDKDHATLELANAEEGPHGLPYSFPGPRVVIRPGQGAKKLTVKAEMETPGSRGGVRCLWMEGMAVRELGWVNWYSDRRKGKEWREETFDLPAEVGVIQMEITPESGRELHVRAMKISVEFQGK